MLRVGGSTPTADAVCIDMTALSINRPCGEAPTLKIRFERDFQAPCLTGFHLTGCHTGHGGDTSVTQTL